MLRYRKKKRKEEILLVTPVYLFDWGIQQASAFRIYLTILLLRTGEIKPGKEKEKKRKEKKSSLAS